MSGVTGVLTSPVLVVVLPFNCAHRCSEWMRFREDIMINTSQMESIMRKLPQSLKEHVSLIIYQVDEGV